MQTHPPIKTSRPAPYPCHWGEILFANGGKDVLFNLGASICSSNEAPLEGTINARKGDGLCGYYTLQESNDKDQAILRRNMIARWILDHPDYVIGRKTVFQHINYDQAGTTSQAYYDHHMGVKPFSNTAHREFQWITPLELVVDCIMTGRSVVVCVDVIGNERGSLFQPFWRFGDSTTGTRYLRFNGSHYDNISGEEPFITVNRNRRGRKKSRGRNEYCNDGGSDSTNCGGDNDDIGYDCGDISKIEFSEDGSSEGDTSTNISGGDGNAAGSINGDSYNSITIGGGGRNEHYNDGGSDSTNCGDNDDIGYDCGDSSEIESSEDGSSEDDTSTNVSGGDGNAASNINGNSITIGRDVRGSSTSDCDPSLLIGKTVLDFFDGDHNIGEVKSFKSAGNDGLPTSENNSILFVVKFDNDILREYCHADLLLILVHGEGKYGFLTLKAWLRARKIYKTISESLASSNASARNLDFLRSIFGFRPNTVITKKGIQKKLKDRNKELHSDRANRLPSNVQYVAKYVLAGLRYFSEHYNSIHGGPQPSIDAPTSDDYPPYNSPEFAARCAV